MLLLKYCKPVISGTLGMSKQTPFKFWHQFRAVLEVYLHSKHFNKLDLSNCKCYKVFWHAQACLTTPTENKSYQLIENIDV